MAMMLFVALEGEVTSAAECIGDIENLADGRRQRRYERNHQEEHKNGIVGVHDPEERMPIQKEIAKRIAADGNKHTSGKAHGSRCACLVGNRETDQVTNTCTLSKWFEFIL